MKKIFMLLIFLYGHLYALEIESTRKVYDQVFSTLVVKPMITVYTEDREYKTVFATSKIISLSDEPEKSDIILITNRSTLFKIIRERKWDINTDEKPILFVTDYRLLEYSFGIVGAFYWKKGRSQLLFIKNRLDAYNITLPNEYKNFIIEEL